MNMIGLARLGRDVEVRHAQDGTPVCNLSLAYNYGKKDSEGKRESQWVEAALWGERAEKLAPYLTKGQQLCVVLDDVCINTYKRSDGSMGASIKARVVSLEFAGKREESEKPATKAEPAGESPAKSGFKDFEEDIPF